VSWCVNRFSLTLLQQDKVLGKGYGSFYGGLDDLFTRLLCRLGCIPECSVAGPFVERSPVPTAHMLALRIGSS
jgi:hypothetical protein